MLEDMCTTIHLQQLLHSGQERPVKRVLSWAWCGHDAGEVLVGVDNGQDDVVYEMFSEVMFSQAPVLLTACLLQPCVSTNVLKGRTCQGAAMQTCQEPGNGSDAQHGMFGCGVDTQQTSSTMAQLISETLVAVPSFLYSPPMICGSCAAPSCASCLQFSPV